MNLETRKPKASVETRPLAAANPMLHTLNLRVQPQVAYNPQTLQRYVAQQLHLRTADVTEVRIRRRCRKRGGIHPRV